MARHRRAGKLVSVTASLVLVCSLFSPLSAAAVGTAAADEQASADVTAQGPSPDQAAALDEPTGEDASQPAAQASPGARPMAGGLSDIDVNNDTIDALEASIIYATNQRATIIEKRADGKTYMVPYWNKPKSQSADPDNIVSFKLHISTSGNTDNEPGTVQIRIPAHLFKDREGGWADSAIMSVPKKPADGWTTQNCEYNYVIDEATNEIVLMNSVKLSPASEATFDIQYEVALPSSIVDLTESVSYDVKATIDKTDCTQASADATAGTIIFDTKAQNRSEEKAVFAKSEEYPQGWGAKPAEDGDDYFYVVWVTLSGVGGYNTQPYTLTFEDEPDNGGTIVGYRLGGTYDTQGASPSPTRFEPTGGFNSNSPVIKVDTPGWSSTNYRSLFVLVKYPKSLIDDGKSHVLSNKVTSTVTGVDDGIQTTREATAKFTYSKMKFTAPPGDNRLEKTGGYTYRGYIDFLEGGREADLQLTDAYNSFRQKASVSQYNLTLAEGGDPSNPADYGQRPLTMKFVDDIFFLAGDYTQELTQDDYEVRAFAPAYTVYDWLPNATETAYEEVVNSEGATHPPVRYYAQFGAGGEWQLVCTCSHTASGTKREFAVDWVSWYNNSGQVLINKPGCTGIKAEVDSAFYRTQVTMDVRIRLKPSERVKAYLEGNETVEVRDVNTLSFVDADGVEHYWGGYGFNVKDKKLGTEFSTGRVAERDQELYGHNMYHRTATDTLTRLSERASLVKRNSRYGGASYRNDTANKCVHIPYVAYVRCEMDHPTNISNTEMVEEGFFKPQESGTFYDLLPLGAELDDGSIRVTTESFIHKYSSMSCDFTYETTPNYKGTGRTLLTVHCSIPEGESNYPHDATGSVIVSGFDVSFTTTISWDDLSDYGLNVLNPVAYETDNDSIAGGFPDDGGDSVKDRLLLRDLDPQSDAERFLYTEYPNSINVLMATETELRKLVRKPGDPYWVTGQDGDVVVEPDEAYDYRLRFGSAINTTTTDIVLFDSLETYHPADGGPQWQGSFTGLDLSQPVNKGIAPVAYYSTVEGLSIDEHHDLTEAAVWSATPPDNLADVTAVAIDLRKAADGSDYVLPQQETIRVVVHMKAPEDGPYYSARAQEAAHAYNNVYLSNTTINTLTNAETPFFIRQDFTQVGLVEWGSLLVTKSVPIGDKEHAFTFNISLKDAGGNPLEGEFEYEGIGIGDGTVSDGSQVQLADGQGLRIMRLPEGARYEVAESGLPAGYVASPDKASGTILAGTTVEAAISNSYTASGSASIAASKELTGRDLREGEFAFELLDESGQVVGTARNDAQGAVAFDELEFAYADLDEGAETTFAYTIREVDGGLGGVQYDGHVEAVSVTVSDNGDGTLSTEVSYDSDSAVFSNVYDAEGAFTPVAHKTLEGADLREGQFSFELLDAQGEVIQAVSNDADGVIEFAPIAYAFSDAGSEFTYTLREVAGSEEGMAYDDAVYTLRVSVEDAGDGTLATQATWMCGEDEADAAEFVNVFTPPDDQGTPPPSSPGGSSPGSPTKGKTPSTGDVLLVLAVLLAAGAGATCALLRGRRRKGSR